MNRTQKFSAFVSAVLLYFVAMYVLELNIRIPFFGTDYENESLHIAFALINAVTLTVPLFFLTLGWTWATLRWISGSAPAAAWWCLGGLVVGLILWQQYLSLQIYFMFLDELAQNHARYHSQPWYRGSPKIRLWDYFPDTNFRWWFGFWILPIHLSIISGLAAATALALRSKRPPRQPLAQTPVQDASEPSRTGDQPGHIPFVGAGATT